MVLLVISMQAGENQYRSPNRSGMTIKNNTKLWPNTFPISDRVGG